MPFSRSRETIVKNANKIEFYSPISVRDKKYLFTIALLKQNYVQNVVMNVFGDIYAKKKIKKGDFLLKFNNKFDKVSDDPSDECFNEVSAIKMFFNYFNVAKDIFNKFKSQDNEKKRTRDDAEITMFETEEYFPFLLLKSENRSHFTQFLISKQNFEQGAPLFNIRDFDEIDQFSLAARQLDSSNILKIYETG